MSRRICLFLFALCCASPGIATPSHTLPPGAVRISSEALATMRFSPTVTRAVATLEAELQVASKASGAIASWCQADDAVLAGSVLARWLDRRVSASTWDIGDAAALSALAECPERVFVRHDEAAGDWWLPAYANNARAGALLRAIERDRLALRAATTLIDQGSRGWDSAWDANIAFAAVSLLDAVERAALARAKALPANLLLALAQSGETTLIPQAIARAPADALVPALSGLFATLPAEQRLAQLDACLDRTELSSAAVLLTGDWPDDRALDAWWLARLGEPAHGASAAQVVARRWTPSRVAAELSAAQSTTLQMHLALALRLNGSAQAGELLRDAARAHQLPPTVAAEVLR